MVPEDLAGTEKTLYGFHRCPRGDNCEQPGIFDRLKETVECGRYGKRAED